MKKIIKIGAILMAAAILITAGVFAAATTRTYEWQATTSVQFESVDTFATVSDISAQMGAFAAPVSFSSGVGIGLAPSTFSTYDTTSGKPHANVTDKNWEVVPAGTPTELTDDVNAIKITFKITNDNSSKGLNVTVTISQTDNLTGLVVKDSVGGNVTTTTGGTAQTPVVIAASGNSTFTYYIVVGDNKNDIGATTFAFKVSMTSAA